MKMARPYPSVGILDFSLYSLVELRVVGWWTRLKTLAVSVLISLSAKNLLISGVALFAINDLTDRSIYVVGFSTGDAAGCTFVTYTGSKGITAGHEVSIAVRCWAWQALFLMVGHPSI